MSLPDLKRSVSVIDVMITKRIGLNFYRCLADINIVVKKANLSRGWDAKPSAR